MIGMYGNILTSARLTYRLLAEKDKASLRKILADAENTLPAGFAPVEDEDDFENFWEKLTASDTSVALLLDEKLIGYMHFNRYIFLAEPFCNEKNISLGIILGKEYSGKGYGTEAVTFFTEYLFSFCDNVFGDCFEENISSLRMFEKSGYVFYEKYEMYFVVLDKMKSVVSNVKSRPR